MSQRALILLSLLGFGAVVSGCDVETQQFSPAPTPAVTQPEGSIRVRVLDPQGRPLSGLDVIVSNQRGSWEGEAKTDAEGVAKLGGGTGSYVSVFYDRGLALRRYGTQHRIDSFLVTNRRDYELRLDPGVVRPTSSSTMSRVSVSIEGNQYNPDGPPPLVFVGCEQGQEAVGGATTFSRVHGCGGPTIKARAMLDRGNGTMLYGESSEQSFVADGEVSLAVELDRTLPAVVYSAGPLKVPPNSRWTLLFRQVEGDGAVRETQSAYGTLPGVAGESFALTPDPGRKVRFFERLFLQQGTLEEGFTHEADATDAAPTARWSTTELKRVRGLRFDENQEQPLVTWEGTEDGSAGDAVVATFSFDTARTSYGEVYSPDDGVPRISPNVVWTVSMPPTTTKHPMLDLTPEIAVRWGKPSNLRFEVAFADAEGAEDYEGYLTAATGTVTRSFASDEVRDYYYYDY